MSEINENWNELCSTRSKFQILPCLAVVADTVFRKGDLS